MNRYAVTGLALIGVLLLQQDVHAMKERREQGGLPFFRNKLTIQPTTQEHSQWCWATVTQLLVNYYHRQGQKEVRQCEIVAQAFKAPTSRTCVAGTAFYWDNPMNQSIPTHTRTALTLQTDIDHGFVRPLLTEFLPEKGIKATYLERPLTPDEIMAEIDAGHPFLMVMGSPDTSDKLQPTHIVLTYGYNEQAQYMGGKVVGRGIGLHYIDPWPTDLEPGGGDKYKSLWQLTENKYNYSNGRYLDRWMHTIKTSPN